MPSGFLVLPDGRCFARRWEVYDHVLRAIINEVKSDPSQNELYLWLQTLLPGPGDIEELGYGAWLRAVDQEPIERTLDMRQLAKSDQDAICLAAIRASETQLDPGYIESLNDLAAMVRAYRRGEPPLSKSDWTSVLPAEDVHIGPGWRNIVPSNRPTPHS